MLINVFLPTSDVTARYELHINASTEHVYKLVRTLDVSQSRIVKILFAVRSLPSFLRKLNNKKSLGLSLEGLLRNGFVLLQEDPPCGNRSRIDRQVLDYARLHSANDA